MSDCLCSRCAMINVCQTNCKTSRDEDISLVHLMSDMVNEKLVKGTYGDYIIYKKDWLYAFLDDEVETLRKHKEIKEKINGSLIPTDKPVGLSDNPE